MTARLALTRQQVLAFRRKVGALDQRLPAGEPALRDAAWAGLQDSMPRAALLSLHARVAGATSSSWEDPALAQVWGPRFSVFVVAADDRAPFTLGRMRADAKYRAFADDLADRMEDVLAGERRSCAEVGKLLGVHPNQLRYAAPTGRVLMRWEGARSPLIWMAPAPDVSPDDPRRELARRFLHIFGPSTPDGFGKWAGIRPKPARAAFDALDDSLLPITTPLGESWALASDEDRFRAAPGPPAAARLLPSGDAYYLYWGADRELLLPDPDARAALWTSRVWPGALLVDGEIVGIWRRTQHKVTVETWEALTPAQRKAVEAEAASLPLPAIDRAPEVTWRFA